MDPPAVDNSDERSSLFPKYTNAHQEFLDSIHGFVYYTPPELAIIDHPAFQRLFRIFQLGQTHLVFRGATHRRGDHALGAVATANQLIDAVNRTYIRGPRDEQPSAWTLGPPFSSLETAIARLSVLLHDIGHIAAGHTIEDELGLLDDHATHARLLRVLKFTNWRPNSAIESEPPITDSLEDRINSQYRELLEGHDIRFLGATETDEKPSPTDILLDIIAKDRDEVDDCRQIKANLAGPVHFRPQIIRDVVSNTICADLIDYLQRDWRYIGKPRYLDQRLFQYLEIRTKGSESNIVVNLRMTADGGYRSDAVSGVLELLENRYHLWEVALLHKTKTCAAAMLERAVAELVKDTGLFEYAHLVHPREYKPIDEELKNKAESIRQNVSGQLLEHIFELSDEELYSYLSPLSWDDDLESFVRLSPEENQNRQHSLEIDLLWRLRHRVLHKQVVSFKQDHLAERICKLLAPPGAPSLERMAAAGRRLESLQTLENDFSLPKGSLVFHCVPLGLGKKIAEVNVLSQNEITTMTQADRHFVISEGHLKAQLKRFEKLWRVSLFVAAEAKKSLEQRNLLEALCRTFVIGVLDARPPGQSLDNVADTINELDEDDKPSYAKGKVPSLELSVANREKAGAFVYPSGVHTLRSYFVSDTSDETS